METRTILPTAQPALSDLKAHLRITSLDMDAELTSKLYAAIRSAEHMIGRLIAWSQFVATTAAQPTITLEHLPVGAVTVVGIVGSGEEEQHVEVDYTISGKTLTIFNYEDMDTIEVTYNAGMQAVEYDIKAAILLHAAALFTNPVDSVEVMPKASSNLLRPYRSWGMGDGR